ncbi:MAG: hypothetical protein P8Y94_16500, partial [Acidobacteriota bacterium]
MKFGWILLSLVVALPQLVCAQAKQFLYLSAERIATAEIVDDHTVLLNYFNLGKTYEPLNSYQVVLQKLTPVDLSAIKFYWFTEGQIAGVRAILSRTGYTGEPGYELYVPAEDAEKIWEAVFEAGKPADICPAGLACRNSLRLEMKYPLYGNDIDETTTPYEAGLGWIVKLGTGFIGENVLERQKSEGVARRLV